MNSQDQSPAKASPKAATTGVPGPMSISLWKRLKQVCVAEPGVDSFEAESFDEDAVFLDDDAAPLFCSSKDGSLQGNVADE